MYLFVNLAKELLSEQSARNRAKFSAGAGLNGPTPYTLAKVKDPVAVKGFLNKLDSLLVSSGFLRCLSQGYESGFPSSFTTTLRLQLEKVTASALSLFSETFHINPRRSRNGSPLRPGVIKELLHLCGCDAEAEALYREIDHGFALGCEKQIPRSKLWPPAKPHRRKFVRRVVKNYPSARKHASILEKLLHEELELGQMFVLDKSQASSATITPVALIPKSSCPPKAEDQLPKHFRIVEDYKRSLVNESSYVPQTIKLPSLSTVVQLLDCFAEASVSNKDPIRFFTLDLKAAYRQVGVAEREGTHLNIRSRGKTYRHKRLPFGHKASAYCFCRTVGAIHRAILSLLSVWLGPDWKSFGLLYVDDMFYASAAPFALRSFAFVSIVWQLCGFTLAPEKTTFGNAAKFIGFNITYLDDSHRVQVSAPPAKLEETSKLVSTILKRKLITRDYLSSLGGKLNWVLQCYPSLSPYKSQVNACLAMLNRKNLNSARLPRQLQEDLLFLDSFLKQSQHLNLSLTSTIQSSPPMFLASDASASGLAGFFVCHGKSHYWSCKSSSLPSQVKKEIFRDKMSLVSSSSDIAALELIACLSTLFAALSLQPDFFDEISAPIVTLNDNRNVVAILPKAYSRSSRIQWILRKATRFLPKVINHLRVFHISSEQNVLADSLSRGLFPSLNPNWLPFEANFDWLL